MRRRSNRYPRKFRRHIFYSRRSGITPISKTPTSPATNHRPRCPTKGLHNRQNFQPYQQNSQLQHLPSLEQTCTGRTAKRIQRVNTPRTTRRVKYPVTPTTLSQKRAKTLPQGTVSGFQYVCIYHSRLNLNGVSHIPVGLTRHQNRDLLRRFSAI